MNDLESCGTTPSATLGNNTSKISFKGSNSGSNGNHSSTDNDDANDNVGHHNDQVII